jgi:hypothetical protein
MAMKHLILRWSAVVAISVSVSALGCSKAEEEAKVEAEPTAAADSQGAVPPKGAASAGPGEGSAATGDSGEDGATRHQKMVENAKNAIPTVASDDQTNAAVVKADKAVIPGDAAAAKKELAATVKAVPAAKSTVADTATYTVAIDAPTGSAGKDSKLMVVVKPKKGWKLNMEFPTKLKLEPPPGVTVAKKTLKKADAKVFSEKKGATWQIGYKSASAGKKKFSGKLKFAVCTDATCDPKSETLAFAVDVK